MPKKQWIDFTALRSRAQFEPVLTHYGLTPLGRGAQKTILCPFHDEKTPSCKVNLEKRTFHCFGCDAKGNVLDFVAKIENAELPEAARKLAEICAIPLAEVSKEPDESKPARNAASRPHRKPQDAREPPTTRKAAPAAQTSLSEPPGEPEGPINPPLTFTLKLEPAHPYLAERNIGPELVEAFGLGFCNRGMMKGRICIPIHNEAGELVAYAGRWPGDTGWPEGEDKYKLPQGFRKSHVLFNLHRMPETDELVVVEGYFAAFRLHALGVPVVALMGCSISAHQAALLAHRAVRAVVLVDGDTAGQAARRDVVPTLAGHMLVRSPLLPDGTSPDTLEDDALKTILGLS